MSSVAAAGALTLLLAGCNDFLKAKDLTHNPNYPTVGTTGALFIAAQADIYYQNEGQLARTVCIWMQQCGGQAAPFSSLALYIYGADDYLNNWSAIYDGGGLIDLKSIEQQSLAIGDSLFTGQAIVLEALQISMGADIWGNVPYSQASQFPAIKTPISDPQAQVYDSLEKALSQAIIYMSATGGTNVGALANDNLYGGAPAPWIALANTLKARIFIHQAAKIGATAYDSVLTYAQQGITDATGAGDFISVHTATANTANLWSDFQSIYAGDISAGGTIVNIMNGQTDPRLPAYFTDVSGSYIGSDTASGATLSTLSATRSAQTFGQPIVTYAENQLMIAEAYCQLGNKPAATTAFQAEQAEQGVTPSGPVNLGVIMTEKYIALFQNIEVWNDWKRTGYPVLGPLGGSAQIPRRLTYPLTERDANPNTPPDGVQNPNDPTTTPGVPIASGC